MLLLWSTFVSRVLRRVFGAVLPVALIHFGHRGELGLALVQPVVWTLNEREEREKKFNTTSERRWFIATKSPGPNSHKRLEKVAFALM